MESRNAGDFHVGRLYDELERTVGLVSGMVFLLVIGFYRFVLPKLADESRKLSNEANSLLAPKAANFLCMLHIR